MAKKTAKKKADEADGAAKKPAKRKTTKRKAKETVDAPKKLYWGVFNQSLKRVALFEFNQKKQAEKKAEALSKDGKSPHFVQPVKDNIEV